MVTVKHVITAPADVEFNEVGLELDGIQNGFPRVFRAMGTATTASVDHNERIFRNGHVCNYLFPTTWSRLSRPRTRHHCVLVRRFEGQLVVTVVVRTRQQNSLLLRGFCSLGSAGAEVVDHGPALGVARTNGSGMTVVTVLDMSDLFAPSSTHRFALPSSNTVEQMVGAQLAMARKTDHQRVVEPGYVTARLPHLGRGKNT